MTVIAYALMNDSHVLSLASIRSSREQVEELKNQEFPKGNLIWKDFGKVAKIEITVIEVL